MTEGALAPGVWRVFPFQDPQPPVRLHRQSAVFRVRDRRGDWVVKRTGMVHSGPLPIDRWLCHVHDRGAMVVRAAAGFGANPRVLEDGDGWVVYPFIEGAAYAGAMTDIEEAGALLGHLHVAGTFNDWGLKAFLRPPLRGWPWVVAQAAQAAAAARAAGQDAGALMALVEARWSDVPPPGGLPIAGGSFDFKACNLVFTPAPVLVDPDHAAYLPRAYDLAVAALLFHAELASAPARLWTAPEWAAFRAGYGRTIRLSAAERDAWPAVLRLAWLDQGLWLLANGDWQDAREAAFLTALAAADLAAFPL